MKAIAKGFWKNKKVLITGYEGFLGSHLTKVLISYGARIFGLDIKVRRKETILTPADYKKITVIKKNIADYAFLKEFIKKNNIQIVFHLAAEAIVGRGYKDPSRVFRSNICGTWSLLEACRYSGKLDAIIVASSDKAYGTHKKLPYTEEANLIGRNPYDVSKSCADLIAYSYFHSYGLPVSVTRCGNIYGPGDFNFSRIVPDAIRCALTGKTLFIRSDGRFTRDYVYVDDIIDGYIILAEKLQKFNLSGEAFNFSDENPMEVIRLVDKISKIIRKDPDYKILNQAKYEIRDQYLASGKARKILGWKPKKSLEEGLKDTIEWYANRL
jgi:CDP-glucose 4,6-dehydratase